MPRRGDIRSRVWIPIMATTVALLTAIGGCGALDGSSNNPSGGGSGTTGPIEKPKLRVGLLPVVDVAPLYQAVEKGYFREQGLDVEPVVVASGPKAVESVISGEIDIAFTSYPGAFVAQSKGVANLKIVADAYAARPGHLALVAITSPTAKIKKPEDVAEKKIAVTSKGSISDLGVMSVLSAQNIPVDKIQWVPMPFQDMGPAMKSGNIDGAVVAEPWRTRTAKEFGAMTIVDVSSGPTANISMSGWAATDKLTSANPHTFAAFQRGLNKGVADVKKDRTVLEPILKTHIRIDEQTAPLVTIADYPERADAIRLQRVADLMLEFKVIGERLDVSKMLLEPTATN
ncbi:ABC transporter substrate-binding protein [Kibdelosporangium philippinense]|uniref:ABC transporter substrate-binding protein n=1 Tax=Kibdelosporangium philippinense TaxID=211113 RepID=A0ABS8ZNF0_9PSEU|nr:ABC transporter substrate-binding protein [Kibdelosporangium philippinense]MCE7009099.1 ABC transporter substrate-binding protein [Kibdelosporangium philippinense]